MQLFGSLKLLMALLGSSCPLLGRSNPKMGPKMDPKSGPKSDQKVVQKITPKNDQKMTPKNDPIMTTKWFKIALNCPPGCGTRCFPQDKSTICFGIRAQMGPSGMVWESSATGLGRTGQPKSQANRKALQGPYKAL